MRGASGTLGRAGGVKFVMNLSNRWARTYPEEQMVLTVSHTGDLCSRRHKRLCFCQYHCCVDCVDFILFVRDGFPLV